MAKSANDFLDSADKFLDAPDAPRASADDFLGSADDFLDAAPTDIGGKKKIVVSPMRDDEAARIESAGFADVAGGDPFGEAYADVAARGGPTRDSVSGEELVRRGIRAIQPKPTGREGEKDVFEAFGEMGEDSSRFVPFLGSGIEFAKVGDVYDAAIRLNKGNAYPEDADLVKNWLARNKEDATRDTTLAYKVANIVSHLPAFVGEFAATGGLYNIGKAAASRALKQKLLTEVESGVAKKGLARLGVEAAAGAAVQAPVAMAGHTAKGATERLMENFKFSSDEKGNLAVAMEDNVGFNEAMAKALGDSYIEILSERSGAALPAVWAKVPGADKINALKAAVVSRWFKTTPNPTVDKLLKTMRDKGGWHGVLGEMFEERVGEAARYATGIEDEYRPAELYRKG